MVDSLRPDAPDAELLRVFLGGDTSEAAQIIGARLVARIVQALAEMSPFDVQRIAHFVEICNDNHGCDTPAEEFITELVHAHSLGGLTPELAEGKLAGFRLNFDDAVAITKRFNTRYRQIVQEVPNAE